MPKKIVTHGGEAHLDDLMSVSLVLALDENVKMIERRNPTEEDLNSKEVWVLDEGGRIEPEFFNYDHHQLENGIQECTLSLIAEHFKIKEYLSSIPWYRTVVLIDSLGPDKAAEVLQCRADVVKAVYTPSDEFFLIQFKALEKLEEGELLFEQLKKIGKNVTDYYYKTQERLELLRESCELKYLDDIPVIYFLKRVDSPMMAVYKYAIELGIRGGICVCVDERGDGWCIRRLFEDENIDLYRLEGEMDVRFTHPAGFISKVEKVSMERVNELIILSKV